MPRRGKRCHRRLRQAIDAEFGGGKFPDKLRLGGGNPPFRHRRGGYLRASGAAYRLMLSSTALNGSAVTLTVPRNGQSRVTISTMTSAIDAASTPVMA